MPPTDTSTTPKCYTRPKVGDVYRRFTMPHRYQEGTVVSMDVTRVVVDKPTDIIETWVAVLVYGENEMWKFGWQTLQLQDQAHWQPVAPVAVEPEVEVSAPAAQPTIQETAAAAEARRRRPQLNPTV